MSNTNDGTTEQQTAPQTPVFTGSNQLVADIGGPVVADGVETNLLDRRTVTIKLATKQTDTQCNFWIGLARKGELSPGSLLDKTDVAKVFEEAAQKGVSDDGPIMLSDTSVVPPRFVYLTQLPGTDFRERALWVTALVSMIKSWAPKTAGFYMAPELIEEHDSQELLSQVLRELILTTDSTDFYLLVGAHGLNKVLNTSLRLKLEIENETLNLLVFH